MKVRLTFKTPDVVSEAARDILRTSEDRDLESIYEEISAVASKWISYGEYVTLELDLVNKTCTIIPVRSSDP